jgi:AraC-like DNA-binding protein
MSSKPFELRFFQSAVNMDLKLYYCGSENCLPNHSMGPALRDHYKIHYVHSGTGIFRVEGKTYTLTAGQGFLIIPGVVCYYKADEHDPWSYSWVGFMGLHAELYLKRAQLSIENPIFSCDPTLDASIEHCFGQMFEARNKSVSRDLKLLGLLYSFLATVVDASGQEAVHEKSENVKEQYVKMALDFIETHYSHNMSIESLADELKLNRKYMSKIFKDEIGLTPQEYLIRLRMNKACELMKNPSLGIGEISYSVGYNDQLLFSRMFKKNLGASPRLYRKSL